MRSAAVHFQTPQHSARLKHSRRHASARSDFRYSARSDIPSRLPTTGFPRSQCSLLNLVRAWQAEDVLGHEVEHHLLRDRSDAHETRLLPEALHVVFGRVSHSTHGYGSRP